MLQVVHRVIKRFLLGQAGLKTEDADSGAVALIQPILHDKGSAEFYVSLLFTFNDSFGSGTPLRPEDGAGPTVP